MRLTTTTFVTIDGLMQSPGAPREDPGNGFDLGGWLPPMFDEETGEYMNGVFDAAGAFLLGRKTYEAMAGYWPDVTDPAIRVGTALNTLPQHVVTTTLLRDRRSAQFRLGGLTMPPNVGNQTAAD